MKKNNFFRIIKMILFFELVIFWFFISANFHLFILKLGFLGIIITYFICSKIFRKMNERSQIYCDLNCKISLIKGIQFIFFTLIDIFYSSIFLIKQAFREEETIDLICEIDFSFIKKDDEMNLLAHYITSTPGSISIKQINKRKFLIHVLYKKNLDDLENLKNNEKKLMKLLKII